MPFKNVLEVSSLKTKVSQKELYLPKFAQKPA